jgi:hypothetical protein
VNLRAISGTSAALAFACSCGTDLQLADPHVRDGGASEVELDAGDAGSNTEAGVEAGIVNNEPDVAPPDASPVLEGGSDLDPSLCLHVAVERFVRSDSGWGEGQTVSRYSGYEGHLVVHDDELLAITNAHAWTVAPDPIALLEVAETGYFWDLLFADWTGDSRDEAITIGQDLDVFKTEPDAWHLVDTLPRPADNKGFAAAVGDFNEDGHVDIASVSGAGHEVFLGDGMLGYSSSSMQYEFPMNNLAIETAYAADVDGDDHLDLVFYATFAVYLQGAEHDASLYVLRGNGDGSFQAPQRNRLPGPDLQGVAEILADFTGDDVLDAAFQMQGATYLAPGHGDGLFGPAVSILEGINTPSIDRSLIAVADVNGDGLSDLAVPDDQAAHVLIAIGEGAFAPEVVAIEGYLESIALHSAQAGSGPSLSALSVIDGCPIE